MKDFPETLLETLRSSKLFVRVHYQVTHVDYTHPLANKYAIVAAAMPPPHIHNVTALFDPIAWSPLFESQATP